MATGAPRASSGLWWKVLLVALFAFASAAAFSAWLQPGMLMHFANFVLCT